jgi:hypothetical protein
VNYSTPTAQYIPSSFDSILLILLWEIISRCYVHYIKNKNIFLREERGSLYVKSSGTFSDQGPLMVALWLRYCATNRKVAGSIPGGVNGIFH